jgi:TfoX/Sxy family transcriptional regulator of competence genes
MASDLDFIEYVVDQMEDAGVITCKPMFGGHTVYCHGKVVALICDNQLFVKPTQAGRTFIGDVVEAPAYPGAKLSFLIEEELEDKEWISRLIRLTEKELPMPKAKKKKPKSGKKT